MADSTAASSIASDTGTQRAVTDGGRKKRSAGASQPRPKKRARSVADDDAPSLQPPRRAQVDGAAVSIDDAANELDGDDADELRMVGSAPGWVPSQIITPHVFEREHVRALAAASPDDHHLLPPALHLINQSHPLVRKIQLSHPGCVYCMCAWGLSRSLSRVISQAAR